MKDMEEKFKFLRDNPELEQRKKECEKIRSQFNEKIPIICEKAPKSNIGEIDKTKYLVPSDLSVNQFNMMIRKRLQIDKEAAFYLLVNGKKSISGEKSLADIYEEDKAADGFLYINYASELTWG